MAEITLVYGELEDASICAKKVADNCVKYRDELTNKLANKLMGAPESPLSSGNSRMSNAKNYIVQKKNLLIKKESQYRTFSSNVNNLISNAKAADKRVANSVYNSRKTFYKEHPGLEASAWEAFFANICIDFPNIGWIADCITTVVNVGKDIKNTLRYWYEVCGGKKVVDTILAVGGIVLSVVALVGTVAAIAAGGWTIAAVAGLIGAAIGIFDSITNLAAQIVADTQSDPAWAKYYGGINSTSDWLRKHTFKDKLKGFNKWSNGLATALDVTKIVCSVVSIGNTIKGLYSRSGINKLFSSKTTFMKNGEQCTAWKFDFSKFKQTVTSKNGWKDIGKTLKTSWKGMLFGDSGSIEARQKQWNRAWDSDNLSKIKIQTLFDKKTDVKAYKDAWTSVKRVTGVLTTNISAVTTTLSTTQTMYEGWTGSGFDFSTIYSVAKDTYDVSGGGGAISGVAFKTIDTIKKYNNIRKTV